QVAGAQIDLALVCLGPRLIEALLEVVAIEHDEIHDGLEGNANPLAFFHLPRRPAVHPYGYVMQGFHWPVSSTRPRQDGIGAPKGASNLAYPARRGMERSHGADQCGRRVRRSRLPASPRKRDSDVATISGDRPIRRRGAEREVVRL